MTDYRSRLINERFGRLTVKSFHSLAKGNKTVWLCICDCGREKIVRNDSLVKGATKSCGCLNTKTGNASKHWKGYEEIYGGYWSRIQKEAKKRSLTFSLSIEEAWDIFLKQNRKCALTGDEIGFANQEKRTASLDRIDSSKGYIEGNVQWVHTSINRMKTNLNEDKFIELCKIITEYQNGIIKV